MSNLRASLFILLGILIMVGFFSGLIYLKEKENQRYEKDLKSARAALEEGRLVEATDDLAGLVEADKDRTDAAMALYDAIVYFDRNRARQLLNVLEERGLEGEKLLYRRMHLLILENNADAVGLLAPEIRALQPRDWEGAMTQILLNFFEGNYEKGMLQLRDLSEAFPDNRYLRFLTGEFLSVQETLMNRIMAKGRLMDLLQRPDEFSFRAAILLSLRDNLPLFPSDRRVVARHLEEHPFLDQGLARLEIALLRRLSDRLAEVNPPLAFYVGSTLVRRPDATLQDQLIHLYTGQLAGELEAVQLTVDSLLQKPDHEQTEAVVLARQLAISGRYAEARQLLEKLLAREPDSPAAFEIMGWLAANHLSSMPDETKAWLAEALQVHPRVSPPIWLRANGTLMELRPADRDSLIRAAVRRYGSTEPLLLCRWLLEIGQPEQALELLPEGRYLAATDAFLIHYDALLALQRYSAARALLEMDNLPLQDWERDLLLARVYLLSENPEACAALIEELINTLPANARGNLFNLAEMAGSIGSRDLQQKAYARALATGSPFPLPHAMAYLGMLLELQDLDTSLRFAAYCRNLAPDNLLFINNHAYMQLLAGREVEDCIADMREVVEADPDFREFRLTLAMAELLGGYPGQARETLGAIGEFSNVTDPRSRLSIALVLAGSGELEAARVILADIDTASLLQAERDLVDAYFRDARSAQVAVRELPQEAIDLRTELESIRQALGADREALLVGLVDAESAERRAALDEWDATYNEQFRSISALSSRLRALMEAHQSGDTFTLPEDMQAQVEELRQLRRSLEEKRN